MGLMRFIVHDRERIVDGDLSHTFIAGPDEIPYHGRAYFSGDQLYIDRHEDASGCLCTPWLLSNHGVWLVASATLMQRDRPYQLEVELARGAVYRLRNQLAAWELLGLIAPEDLLTQISGATSHLARAATQQSDPAAAASQASVALDVAANASLRLAEVYSQQALAVRQASAERLPTLMGVALTEKPPEQENCSRVQEAFSLIAAPCGWKSIEPSESKRRWRKTDAVVTWAQEAGLRICGGPLLEFSDQRIPEWAYLWEGDFEATCGLMIAHVEATIKRYRGRVNLWNVASQVNRGDVLSMTDEQRLHLVARAVRRVRDLDPKAPVVVSFDQPWAENMATQPAELSPLDFADALERADLGISGFGLELNIGYLPHGASPRDPLAFSRMLDLWTLRLEVPLLLSVTIPSGRNEDPLADLRNGVIDKDVPSDAAQVSSPELQMEWVERYLPMFVAKNCVQVIIWNQHRDDRPHELPHGGLLDSQGSPKAAYGAITQLRKQYLV